MIGTAVVVVAMRTVELLAPRTGYDRRVGWMVALHPSLILYSALILRESAVVLAFGLSIYWLVRWRTSRRYRCLPVSVACALVSQLFHTGMVTASVAIVVLGIVYVLKEHSMRLLHVRFSRANLVVTVGTVAFVSVLVVVTAWAISVGFGVDKLQRLGDGDVLGAIVRWQVDVARGRASYLTEFSPSSWLGLLWQIPVRLVYFLGAPFAWHVAQPRDLWGLVDGLVFLSWGILIIGKAGRGAVRGELYRMLCFVAFSAILGFSVATSNYGTAFRHRAKFVPIVMLLVVYGSHMLAQSRASRSSGRL